MVVYPIRFRSRCGCRTNCLITVGGIGEIPGVVDRHIALRDYLNLTISFDHDMIDGAPATRFTGRLKDLIESGYGLIDQEATDIETGSGTYAFAVQRVYYCERGCASHHETQGSQDALTHFDIPRSALPLLHGQLKLLSRIFRE